MAIVNTAHVTVEGTVESVNDRGIKLNGDWINLSKFRPLDLPDAGARVRAEVDPRGYLCALEVLEPAALEKTPAVSSRIQRDETITRLSVLRTAAEFLAQMGQMHEGVRSDHVIPLAEKWLAWVLQDG